MVGKCVQRKKKCANQAIYPHKLHIFSLHFTRKINFSIEPFGSNHQKCHFSTTQAKKIIKWESCGLVQNGHIPNFADIGSYFAKLW